MDPHKLDEASETDSRSLLENAIREGNLDAVIKTGKCDPKSRDNKGNTPLHLACLYGKVDIVGYLISQNCDPGVENKKRELPLHIACAQRSLEIVKLVSGRGVDCNATTTGGDRSTPLHIACKGQQCDFVRYLVEEKRCDPNIRNFNSELPLHVASGLESLDIVRIVSDCDVNARMRDGSTPLHIACRSQQHETVRYLVEEKGCVPYICNIHSELPLHVASGLVSLEIVAIVSDCDVNATRNNGDTPLHIACRNGTPQIVQFLLTEKQCNLFLKNRFGELPQHIACGRESTEIVKLFSDKWVDVTTNSGDTSLHIACRDGSVEVVEYLIKEMQCDPSITNSISGYSLTISLDIVKLVSKSDDVGGRLMILPTLLDDPLIIAVAYSSLNIVRYLIDVKGNEVPNLCLALACKYGNLDVVRYFTQEKHCSHSHTWEGSLPLHYASRHSLEMVKLVCDCDMNTRDNKSRDTPLHIACKAKNLDIVEYLVETKRCDTAIENWEKELPLHIACKKGSLDLVKLVSNNCDVNAMSYEGTPLHVACEMEKLDIVEYLVETKHCLTTIGNWQEELPLHIACEKGSLDMVKLISNNCDVNAMSYEATALHVACEVEKLDIVEYLVETKHCLTTIGNRWKELPLHIACKKGRLDMVKLVSNSCDVNAMLGKGTGTPLHIASEMGEQDIVRYLIHEKHCDTTLRNSDGKTAVDVAIEGGRLHIVETITGSSKVCCDGNSVLHMPSMYASVATVRYLIEERHLDPSTPNHHGDTPLHLACREGRAEVVSYLTNHCDPTIANNDGELPIHIACRTSSLKVIELVSCVDLNTPTKHQKDTPLHIACREGRTDVVQYLLNEKLCDPVIENGLGQLPLDIACEQKSLDMLQVLSTYEMYAEGMTLHRGFKSGSPRVVEYLIEFLLKQGDQGIYTVCRGGKLDLVTSHITNSNVNVSDKYGNTFLHYACMHDAEESIRYLIEGKLSDPTIRNLNGELPLHIACMHGSLGVVKLLCDYLDVNTETTSGNTALHLACKHGYLPIVEYLIKVKYCASSFANSNGELPLHIACAQSSLDLVKLVSEECDPNTKSQQGDTPLDIAVKKGTLPIVRFLIEEKHCELSKSDTLLHIACKHNQPEIAQYLIRERNINPTMPTILGETPFDIACELESVQLVQAVLVDVTESTLHTACKHNKPKVLDYLVKERHSEISQCNINGDSLLHYATRVEATGVMKYLLKRAKCSPTVPNKLGELPLHIACTGSSLEMVKLLTIDCVDAQTPEGNTPLHIACMHKRYAVMEYLVNEQHCNLAIPNNNKELTLHIACTQKSLNLIKLLSNCDVNTTTSQGNTPLHLACREGVISIVGHLILDRRCDVSIANCDSELPLHIACREQTLEIVELLATNCQVCTLDIQTAQGNTPLHEACGAHKGWIQSRQNAKNIVQYLMKEHHCDPNVQNVTGRTPLHYACQFSATEVVEYLLSHGNADHSVKDLKEQTPLMFASEPQVIRVLLDHGVDPSPLYKAYHNFFKRHQSSGDPLPTPVRILVLGNASNGKTTLIESLKCEKGEATEEVEAHTAGIIPTNFDSGVYGFVTLYDFAGQHEYYASHEAILHNVISSSPPVILLVVNISEPDEDIRRQLLYWLSFIENQCTLKVHLIVIGSHADMVCHHCDPLQRIEAMIQSFKSKLATMPVEFSASAAMDCREPTSPGIDKLRRQLKTSSDQLRKTTVMNFTCHCLYVFLLDKFRSQPAVTISEVMTCDEMQEARSMFTDDESEEEDIDWSDYSGSTLAESSDDETMETVTSRDLLKVLTRNSSSQVVKLCEELSSRSTIVFLKNYSDPSASLVILDREALMSKVTGTIFAPQGFERYRCLATTSTGVVPFYRLAAYFRNCDIRNCDILTSFLCHLEFCQEICDEKTLQLILESETPAGSAPKRYFFFPGLISIDSPREVWQQDGSYGYKSAWVLHCCQEGQFFTPRFLQVLILRLAFAFALPTDVPKCTTPAFERKCSLWKSGIRWLDMNGVEAIVEVIEQTHVVHVMMQCYQGSEIQCVQLRSAVISKVLEAINEFCPCVAVVESFVHPSELNHYPLPRVEELTLFNVKSVAMTITSSGVSVVNEDGTKQVPFNKLLYFEPYSCMGKAILQKLYDPGDYSSCVSDDFICECACQVPSELHNTFKRLFNPQATPTQELVGVLQAWRDNSEGSYSCFREKLDEFSVLCGRNPLDLIATTGVPPYSPDASIQPRILQCKFTRPRLNELTWLRGRGGSVVKTVKKVAHKWENLAYRLLFEPGEVETIRNDTFHQSEKACLEVLRRWLLGEHRSPVTWLTLVKALRECEFVTLADDLEAALL